MFNIGESTVPLLMAIAVPAGKPLRFSSSTEDGTISGWNPGTNVAAGAKPPSVNAVLEVDNSDKGSRNSAVYKGLTSGEIDGKKVLYAANFRSGRVEVYDTYFRRVHLDEDAFDDDEFLPYWAELWRSGVALAEVVSALDVRDKRVLELGAGLGLPSLAAALRREGACDGLGRRCGATTRPGCRPRPAPRGRRCRWRGGRTRDGCRPPAST